jgi:hypothetical protein
MSKKNKPKSVPPTLEDAFGKLTDDEKTTELAKGITVTDVYGFIEKNERKKVSKFIYERFYRRYIMPFEQVCREYNSGFAQMAACCLMIEALESFRNGWKTTHRLKVKGKEVYGGKIFGDFFKHYSEFTDFADLGSEFYDSIRCGILHQAETKNGWRITREEKYPLLDKENRIIHSTRFRYRMKTSLRKYCKELENNNAVWDKFIIKMAFVIQNCHKGNMKS